MVSTTNLICVDLGPCYPSFGLVDVLLSRLKLINKRIIAKENDGMHGKALLSTRQDFLGSGRLNGEGWDGMGWGEAGCWNYPHAVKAYGQVNTTAARGIAKGDKNLFHQILRSLEVLCCRRYEDGMPRTLPSIWSLFVDTHIPELLYTYGHQAVRNTHEI
ncbi:hypothetical protein GX50_02552 [[Emmonsia] crescens]|uniref:Uncharacterized protein n=1 Tax=[Emmonsia] crescens TaxID=73230 RepID=A0A2B7ZNS3_9EURO|nr:hypothetical protein GX50_02552 [Emmonsia crescens]